MQQRDVVIIGGGLSGLVVARALAASETDYLLLEAKHELGGRILGKPSLSTDLDLDLGPTWFWPHQPRIQQLVKDLGLSFYEQYTRGDALYQFPGQPTQKVDAGGSMLSYRVRGGMANIIQALAARLEPEQLRTNAPARHIKREDHHWLISLEETVISCKHLILAAPPRLLLQLPELTSILSPSLVKRLQATPTWMAAQAKFVASYSTAFWREQGLSGDAFSRVGPMVEIHDASADTDAGYALFGFIGVPFQHRKQVPNEALEQACLEQLVHIFGEAAKDPVACYLIDWGRDSHVATEMDLTQTPAHPELDLSPFSGELAGLSLDIAGSEASLVEGGYLEGAIYAAEQVTNRLLQESISKQS